MSVKAVPRFSPPAGATPNELAASGPGSAAAMEWQAGFEKLQRAQREAGEQRRVVEADRPAVLRYFTGHVADLEARMVQWAGLGALGGGFAAGVATLGAEVKRPSPPDEAGPQNTGTRLWARLLTMTLAGASVGMVGGALVEQLLGPRRARVSPTMPREVESMLKVAAWTEQVRRQGTRAANDPLGLMALLSMEAAPAWRVEGWRATWAELAMEHNSEGAGVPAAVIAVAQVVAPPALGRAIGVAAKKNY